jgi:predicted dehydrogenase
MTAVMIDDQFFPIQGHYNSTWRGDVSQVGAGTLLEHAIHDVDVLCWYFGPVRRVYGVSRHFAEKEGVEDLTVTTLEFGGGMVVSHVSIWHNLLHRGSSRRMTVVCENAQFRWDDNDWVGPIRADSNALGRAAEISTEEVLRRYIDGADIPERIRDVMSTQYVGLDYTLEDYAFLRAVSEERPGFPDFDTAVYAHRVVDSIYESARAGRPVSMADPR